MEEPAVRYMLNRAPQLAIAMVSAAAITMPRREGALRGSLEETFTGSNTRGPVEINQDAMAAVMGVVTSKKDASLSDMMIQQFAINIGMAAATAIFSQFALQRDGLRMIPSQHLYR